jgi:fibronectin-binding autotransporter adhesin
LKLGSVGSGSNTPLGTTGGATSVTSGAALDLGGFTLVTAEALTLNGTGVSLGGALMNSGAAATYSGLVTLGSASSIIGGSGTITLSNAGTILGNTFGLTLGGAQGGTVSSIIGTGTGTITKQDAGTWNLSRVNTFTGNTTISGGTLAITGSGQLNSGTYSGAIAVSSGAIFTWSSTANQTFSTLAAGAGTINLNGSSGTVTISTDQEFTGTLNVAQSVIVTGGTNNANTGLGKSDAININNGGTITVSGLLNNVFIGTSSDTVDLTINSGGVLTTSSNNADTPETMHLRPQTLTLAGGTLAWAGTRDTQWGTWNLGTDIIVTQDSTITANKLTINKVSLSLNIAATKTLTISGTIISQAEAIACACDSNALSVNGGAASYTGTVVLSGSNTYKGATNVVQGVLRASNSSALGGTTNGTTVSNGAALQLLGGITIGLEALTLNGTGVSDTGSLRNISGNNTYGGLITLSTNAVRINSDADTLTLNKSTDAITATNINLTIGGSGNTTVSTIISTGSGTLTKDGLGTLTLSGANSYTGATTISAGTLTVSGSLSNSTAVSVSTGATYALGVSDTIGSIAGAGTVSLSSNTLTAGGDNTSTTVSGSITGTGGALTKTGSGTLTLSGANTHTQALQQ